jgi:hypothetical protein
MNLIALRHRPSSSRKTENNGDGTFTVATVSKSTQSTQSTQIHNVHSLFANQKTRPNHYTLQSVVIRANPCKPSIPDLLRLNRLNRKDLIRFHLLHPLHKLLSLFTRIEHHPVVQPARAYLVASPHRLGHRFPSKQSIEFQVLQPKQLRVSVLPVATTHFNTFPGDKSHSTPIHPNRYG